MAKTPRLWKPGSFKPLRVDGKRDKAERYIVTHGKDAGAIISKAERIRRVFGLHPTKLAEARKAGFRGYKSAASEQQAKKQIAYRQARSNKLRLTNIAAHRETLFPNFIGKETTPLDDDNELIDDGDEPVLECNELVLRGGERNLQPLVNAGIEFRHGRRLTFKEIDALKSRVKITEDGSLAKRDEIDDQNDADVCAWKARIKTWQMLCSFGRFPEISNVSGIPIDALDYAARHGDNDDKLERAKLYGRYELPHQDFDWQAVRDAIDTLSGRKERIAELRLIKAGGGWPINKT
jgi:hypothetical protein